jgi:hypothetical protein
MGRPSGSAGGDDEEMLRDDADDPRKRGTEQVRRPAGRRPDDLGQPPGRDGTAEGAFVTARPGTSDAITAVAMNQSTHK